MTKQAIIFPVRVPESVTSSVSVCRISPGAHPHCVCLPESFMTALMETGIFFFGATTINLYRRGWKPVNRSSVVFPQYFF